MCLPFEGDGAGAGTSAEASAQADPAPMVEFWATPTGSNANNHPSASSSDGSLRSLPVNLLALAVAMLVEMLACQLHQF